MKPANENPTDETLGTGAVLSFDELDQVLGYHIRQAQGVMHRRFIDTLAVVDLTQRQAGALWLIGANPGASQTGLGSALRMDRATTMSIIDRLEARDLVVRQRSKIDRRRHELFLTPDGQKMLVRVKALVMKHENSFSDRFSSAELAQLVELLKRISG